MTTRGADYKRRKNDDYPTPPEVLDVLFDCIAFDDVIDPACGKLKRVLKAAKRRGLDATGSDIISGCSFFEYDNCERDIITNPPYGDRRGTLALQFIEHALWLSERHRKLVAMLLPIDFDSGKSRAHVFQHPAFALKIVLLDRIRWFNGQSGSTNHAWYLWDWDHHGAPIIKYARINHGGKVTPKRRAHRAGSSAPAAGRRHRNRQALGHVQEDA
jgi:hypothetical protein